MSSTTSPRRARSPMSCGASCRRSRRCWSTTTDAHSKAERLGKALKDEALERTGHSRGMQRGWALVSVLWIVSMLAMLAAATQTLTVTSYKTERRAEDMARADADLGAAVVRAASGIADPDLNHRWRVDGIAQSFGFDGATLHVAVQDE